MRNAKKNNFKLTLSALLLSCLLLISGCSAAELTTKANAESVSESTSDIQSLAVDSSLKLEEIEEYNGKDAYVTINDGEPDFGDFYSTESAEYYSELDKLGRCGVCVANVGKDLMPTEKRGSIGQVKPSGWKTVKYSSVDGKYLYNRCHLIGYQLSGENANEKNLITGTRYLNTEGMLPFENMIADYVKETGNHVLYRVTPIYDGDNLVASGVQMEAKSMEDDGEGILFNVYCYNVQPNITIDYATGDSHESKNASSEVSNESSAVENGGEESSESSNSNEKSFVLNTNTKKFHRPSCKSVNDIKPENRQDVTDTAEDIENQGYSPCKKCNPN